MFVDGHQQAGLLGHVDEGLRQGQAVVGSDPDKSLGGGRATGAHVDDRLVGDDEAVLVERGTEMLVEDLARFRPRSLAR